MANIALLLEESGSKLEDICKVTIYLTDIRYREAVYRVVGRWLKGVFPVSTGLTVPELARPEWLVEIDVIAVIPDEASPMTFSISARCPDSGMFGIAVTSSSMAVAARCAFVRAGVGAVATQNITDPRLGPKGLDLMAGGRQRRRKRSRACSPGTTTRITVSSCWSTGTGGTAHHSGRQDLGPAPGGERRGRGRRRQPAGQRRRAGGHARGLRGARSGEPLPARLLAAMAAGLAAGGEEGQIHSAGMVVADDAAWPMVDLRVDWSDGDPIAELAGHWARWEPQMRDYVTRGLDPTQAPSYGVPGDL